MDREILADRNLLTECSFNASRSSGPGGQNVNKTNTRIELRFNVASSAILTDEEKNLILHKLSTRISKDGILSIVSQTERSQYDNKEKVIERFYNLLSVALTPAKKRKKTRPTLASKVRRMESKQLISRKKELRKPSLED